MSTANPLDLKPSDIEAMIDSASYLEVKPKQTVIAILHLKNGQCVIGEAHCLNPEKFSAELGTQNAHADAVRKIWPMASFMARDAFAKFLDRAAADAAAPRIEVLPEDAPRIILPN